MSTPIFPPTTWPYAHTYVSNLTLAAATATKAYPVFPGRPYVIRGWLSTGTWPGITVTVYTAAPLATAPYYNAASMIPVAAAYGAAFETTFVSAGQCLVLVLAGATTHVAEIAVSAISSHE